MNVLAVRRFSVVAGVLVATLVLLAVSGCGNGGWGESKPAIVTQPASQTVTIGQTASFTVTDTGAAPLV